MSAPTIAPYAQELLTNYGQKLMAATKKRHCVEVLGRYGCREDAFLAAQRLADATRWTTGRLAVIQCKTCRGYHLFVRNGGKS